MNCNFEVRLYEGQQKFDIIYGALGSTGGSQTVGVQKDSTNFTQYEYNTPGTLSSGLQLSYTLAPTAASVSVGGRVMTSSGRGIRNIVITMTDFEGNQRRAMTTSFGYYHFADVAAGETYILTATGKRFTFSQQSQVLNINEDTTDINFIGNPTSWLRY